VKIIEEMACFPNGIHDGMQNDNLL